jgi:NAD(P)-dependent dehydrogenase (short-subunit alcohol dehydrogenase family)
MRKVALVTGGAKRIGFHISLHLAKLDYDIALHYNTSYIEAQNAKKIIEENGKRCELFKLDFNEDSNFNLIENVLEKFGRLDILINNSSLFLKENLLDSTDESFDKTININLRMPYILTRDFGLYCKKNERGGLIINMLDSMIKKNKNNYFIYNLSKKSLRDLTILSAKELAPFIRVNGIALGFILEQEDENFKQCIERIPLKRLGNIDDITTSINFILENSYLTGEVFFVDGGL